jgi:hypothetical protein
MISKGEEKGAKDARWVEWYKSRKEDNKGTFLIVFSDQLG